MTKRWASGRGYKHSPHFFAAIVKYGWEAFKHEILAEGLTREEAEQREIELIKEYKSDDRRYGYNTDAGGSTGAKHSEETKRKIGDANRARIWTQESRQKLSGYKREHPTPPEVAKKIGDKNKGRKHRPESIEKIKAAAQKQPVKNMSTGVIYPSVQDAARAEKLDASHISAVCRGRRKVAGGSRWAYEEVMS